MHPVIRQSSAPQSASITVDSNGNSYVAYTTDQPVNELNQTQTQDIVVFKLNANGETSAGCSRWIDFVL